MGYVRKTEQSILNFFSFLTYIRIFGNCLEMVIQPEKVFYCLWVSKTVFAIFENILDIIIRFLR